MSKTKLQINGLVSVVSFTTNVSNHVSSLRNNWRSKNYEIILHLQILNKTIH
eukprot:Awhi_evm1s5395